MIFIVIQRSNIDYESIRMIGAVTNVLEAINYSVNFYLYCATNGEIRQLLIRNFRNIIKRWIQYISWYSVDDIEPIESYLILSMMERYHKKGFNILNLNKLNVAKDIEFATYQLELEQSVASTLNSPVTFE